MSRSSSPSTEQEVLPQVVTEVPPRPPPCDKNCSLVKGWLIHKSHNGECIFQTDRDVMAKCIWGPSPDCSICSSWSDSRRSKYRTRLREYISLCFSDGPASQGGLSPCFNRMWAGFLLSILSSAGPSSSSSASSSSTPSNPWLSAEGSKFAAELTSDEEDPPTQDSSSPVDPSYILLGWLQKYCPERVVPVPPRQLPPPPELSAPSSLSTSQGLIPLNQGIAGAFLEGVNHHVSCPSGMASDLWPLLQQAGSSPDFPPVKQWARPLPASRFLADPSDFNYHKGLKSLTAPPNPSGTLVKPSPSAVTGFGVASDLLRLQAEAQECLHLLKVKAESLETADYYAIIDHLVKLNLSMASLTGRSAAPFLSELRSQTLSHSPDPVPTSLLSEPFTGPSVLGPKGIQAWSFVPPLEVSALSSVASELKAAFSRAGRSLASSSRPRMFASRGRSRPPSSRPSSSRPSSSHPTSSRASSRPAGIAKKPAQSQVPRRGAPFLHGRGSASSKPSRSSKKRV